MRGIPSPARVVWAGTALLPVILGASCTALRPLATIPAVPTEPALAVGDLPLEEPPPQAPPRPEPEPRVHVVARGETLTTIARRHDTTVAALVTENGLSDPDRLEVGQRLTVPGVPDDEPFSPTGPVLVEGMIWPVEGGRVLSPFGAPRRGRTHTGVDIGGRPGQPILAVEGGVVVFAGTLRGYGTTIVLDHGDGLRSLYAHNRELIVEMGDTVERGDTIARLGRTGNATTDHCHFEIRRGEVPFDPLPLVVRAEATAAGARP